MFCSKCGNPLKDSDRFCTKCGAPVVRPQMPQEQPVVKPSVPQERPAAEPVYAQASGAENAGARPVHHRAAASVQKKSKKGLIIGLSLGGVLIAVLAVVMIFALGKKDGSKGGDSSIPLGYSTVVYDDQYTYILSETETWEPCI